MKIKDIETIKDGEWVQPIKKGYTMVCCDCGLVHTFNFRIRKGKVQFQAFRKQRITGQWRRRSGIKVTYSKEASSED